MPLTCGVIASRIRVRLMVRRWERTLGAAPRNAVVGAARTRDQAEEGELGSGIGLGSNRDCSAAGGAGGVGFVMEVVVVSVFVFVVVALVAVVVVVLVVVVVVLLGIAVDLSSNGFDCGDLVSKGLVNEVVKGLLDEEVVDGA